MQFALDTHYTPEEQEFIRRYNCRVQIGRASCRERV